MIKTIKILDAFGFKNETVFIIGALDVKAKKSFILDALVFRCVKSQHTGSKLNAFW